MKDKDFKNRVDSILHGVTSFLVSKYHYTLLKTECAAINFPHQWTSLIFSINFLLWDTLAMYFEGLLNNAMIFHHSLCVLDLSIPLCENISANFVMQVICIMEISNQPMTFRHFFRLTGRRYTKGYEVSEITFFILYFFVRTLFGILLVY